jgi:hypothetical protein
MPRGVPTRAIVSGLTFERAHRTGEIRVSQALEGLLASNVAVTVVEERCGAIGIDTIRQATARLPGQAHHASCVRG